MENYPSKEKIKNLVLEIIARDNPENTEELKRLMLQRYGVRPESSNQILVELENEGKLHFTRRENVVPTSIGHYVLSQKAVWFWGIIAFSVVTIVSVFTIPEAVYPIAYVRNVLGIIFVLFLPGYAFVKALFPVVVPIKTSSQNVDNIERIALSLVMSLVLVPIVGLILNYTQWGIRLTPIILSLLALTTISAIVGLIREYQTKTK